MSTSKHGVATADGLDALATSRPPDRVRRPGRMWTVILAALIGGYLALACVDLFKVPVSAQRPAAAAAAAAARPAVSAAPTLAAPASSAVSAGPAPSASAQSRPLTVVSLAAFGPAGTADGDNAGIVSRIGGASAAAAADAAAGDTAQAWYSSWYATPAFGNLQAGTGLLLDMGRAVTVSSVRLVLAPQRGADVQVLVGDSPSLAALRPAASAAGAGGTVRLTAAHPVSGRYVVVWFTRLPPDGQGRFQADVYGVTVEGSVAAP